MRVYVAFAAGVAAAVMLWVGVAAQVQQYPGPGSGVVTVTGSVDVANTPTVEASQRGDWRVAITNVPSVSVTGTTSIVLALPDFIRRGARYNVVWPNGERESFTIAQLGTGGWVRVEASSAHARWVSLAHARSVQETP